MKYEVTDEYIELVHKAELFAEVFEYDAIIYDGKFSFYNSPLFRSFEFNVVPSTFEYPASGFLFTKFEERRRKRDKDNPGNRV